MGRCIRWADRRAFSLSICFSSKLLGDFLPVVSGGIGDVSGGIGSESVVIDVESVVIGAVESVVIGAVESVVIGSIKSRIALPQIWTCLDSGKIQA